jgi:hypothetical protein
MKKTFNVDAYRTMVNECLALSECNADVRKGMLTMLEEILHQTGNYKGFQYLMQNQVPADQKPGIFVNFTGLIESTPVEERFDRNLTDSTRVRYH